MRYLALYETGHSVGWRKRRMWKNIVAKSDKLAIREAIESEYHDRSIIFLLREKKADKKGKSTFTNIPITL